MNRIQLQELAGERLRDAEALLNAGRWSGAYYMAGYVVECALKACIAKLTNLHDFPDKDLAVRRFTHKIEALVAVSGVKRQRDADMAANVALAVSWLTVQDWDEKSRYLMWTEPQARNLVAAVSHPANRVLPWIMGHW